MRLIMRKAVAVVSLVFLLLPSPALAHNHQVHYDMTEISYEIMLAAGSAEFPVPAPAGVDPAEWAKFLADMNKASRRLSTFSSGLPAREAICGADFQYVTVGRSWAAGPMGGISHAVSPDYLTNTSGCGAWLYRAGGIFDETNHSNNYTGTVLGLYAAAIDDQIDDTHLEFRPTNAGALSAPKKEISDLWKAGVAVVLVPFYCLVECIFGGCGKCKSDAKDAASDTDPINFVDSWIPGIGDISGDDYVGVWHFINLWPSAPNQYDDNQGLETDVAFNGALDPVEVGLMAVFDLSGLSVDPAESEGVTNYQVDGSDDGLPNTVSRPKGSWNAYAFPHVTFSPVDNLAYFGWRKFRDQPADRPVRYLGNVLHALGDASVPMHVTATSGWGHRPYEDAIQDVWDDLRAKNQSSPDQIRTLTPILVNAFKWRKMITAWRKAHPTQETDVPVRELVKALAQDTFNSSTQLAASNAGTFPFNPVMSGTYLFSKQAAIDFYTGFSGSHDYYQQTLFDGMGAEIAFLTSASEVK